MLFGIIINLSSLSRIFVDKIPIDTTVPKLFSISTRSPTSNGLSTANRNELAMLLTVSFIAIPRIRDTSASDASIPKRSMSNSNKAK